MGLRDLFGGKGNRSSRSSRPSPPSEPTVDDLPPLAPPELLLPLLAGGVVRDDGTELTVRGVDVGEIGCPSGLLLFCDPLVHADVDQVSGRRVPAGPVRVRALEAEVGPDHMRVAALVAVVRDLAPVVWEPEGAYGVDAGVGCFADPVALQALERQAEAYYGSGEGDEPIVDALYSSQPYLHHVVYEPAPGLTMAVCQSGWGDGSYATYAGLADDGEVAVLLTSFDVISADAVLLDPHV